MTTIQVHLIMLALGILAYFFLAGPLRNRKSSSRRLRRHWWMGVFAGLAVAISPLSRIWLQPINGLELFAQALLIAAISLLVLLVIALLRNPVKSLVKGESSTSTEISEAQAAYELEQQATLEALEAPSPSSQPIIINADGVSEASGLAAESGLALPSNDATLDRSKGYSRSLLRRETISSDEDNEDNNETSHADDTLSQSDLRFDSMQSASASQDESTELYKTDRVDALDDIVGLDTVHVSESASVNIPDELSHSLAANDNNSQTDQVDLELEEEDLEEFLSATMVNDELDLSEPEELFADFRQQNAEFELPDEAEYQFAKDQTIVEEVDFDSDLVHEVEPLAMDADSLNHSNELSLTNENIEDAEVVEVEDIELGFDDELSSEYSRPADPTPAIIPTPTNTLAAAMTAGSNANAKQLPATLEAAIVAAKETAATLQSQVTSLESSITELDDIRDLTIDATLDAAIVEKEHTDSLLEQKEELLRSENAARNAAESVITAQNTLIEKAQRQEALVSAMLDEERSRLAALQAEVARTKEMAKTATTLAKRAVIAQQQTKQVAEREFSARRKSEESTRKAVGIARNAITALAAEEKKTKLSVPSTTK